MSLPKSTAYGLLAVGLVLSVVAVLAFSPPLRASGGYATPLAAPDLEPARMLKPVSENNLDGPPPLVRLTGVVLVQGGMRAALVSLNNAPSVLVRIGDPLSEASTVQAIGRDWMAYSNGTRIMRVRAQDDGIVVSSAGRGPEALPPAMKP